MRDFYEKLKNLRDEVENARQLAYKKYGCENILMDELEETVII